jgi:hypothetical protein
MLLHLDTLSWFKANPSLLLILNAAGKEANFIGFFCADDRFTPLLVVYNILMSGSSYFENKI